MSDTANPATSDAAKQKSSPGSGQVGARSRRFRWKLGLAILAVGALTQTIVWNLIAPDRTFQVFFSMPILSATALLFVLWWLFLSGLPWLSRFLGILGAAAAVCSLLLVFRFDGVEGDMFPRFTLRWNQTAQERAEQYWRQQSVQPATIDTGSTSKAGQGGVSVLDPLPITDADWPGFRGSNRDGIVNGVEIRRDWDRKAPNLVWRHPVGLGWSSFAVVGGLAFTQEQRRKQECVVCYDFHTGRQLWVHTDEDRFTEAMGGIGPRATPTVFDSRVYALGATGILNCLEARRGTVIWSRNILQDAGADNLNWAMSGSPLVYDNLVVVSPGGTGHTVVAYDRLTGEKLWAAGNRRTGYAAPRLATIAEMPQILIFGGDGLSGHDANTGRELWFFDWPHSEQVNAAQPIVVDEEAIFFGSGYGKGSVMLDIVSGDGSWTIKKPPRWTSKQLKLKFNGPVAKDGYVYGLDEGILVCLDLATGKRQWKRGRYGYGQLLLIGDVILVQADTGEVVLIEATPARHRQIARFQAIEGKTWNHPVVTRGRLLVRNAQEAACYDLRR